MDRKNKTYLYVAYKRLTLGQKTHRLKVKGWKKIFCVNRNNKKAEIATLVSDKMDFKTKNIKRQRTLHNDKGVNPRRI